MRRRSEDRWSGRPIALFGQVGYLTPYGMLGVALDLTPTRWLSVDAGAGLDEGGPSYGAMARARVPLRAVGFGLGAGWSRQKAHVEGGCGFMQIDCERKGEYWWGPSHRVNLEAFIEGRTDRGFAWRGFVGGGRIVSNDARDCEGSKAEGFKSVCSPAVTTFGYFGAAFGYAFQL